MKLSSNASQRYRKTLHNVPSLAGKIILDPSKDPDPYSNHSIPLSVRLQHMGWV